MAKRDPFELCGTVIEGKYRVLSVVGEGGFGVVYKGVHEGFDAPVAIKCLKLPPHFDLAAQDALVRQLREEGRTLLRLSQRTPGILQALDVGSFTTPSGARVPYLVLEWLEGRTLAEELDARGSGMPLVEAFALLDPAARALAVAHDEKVAHRDIKPENMFCIASGGKPTIKILDFGIAKLLGDAASPLSGTAVGGPSMFTPNYAAPEQFDKNRGASGPWTDVFAFALVLVEMVTGRQALEGDTLFALFHASSDPGSRPTPRARGVATTDAVERVLEKALHPQATERYPDVGSFWKALGEAIEKGGTSGVAVGNAGGTSGVALGNAHTVQMVGAPVPPMGSSAPASYVPVSGSYIPASSAPVTGSSGPVTGSSVAVTGGSPAASPRRSPIPWIALGIVVLGGGIALAQGAMHAASHPSPEASASAAVAAAIEPPVSSNPAAAALYRDALQAWHDGSVNAAIRGMEQAIVLDPELGAAQIRLALWHFMAGSAAGKQVEGREHFQAAMLHRNALGELDKGLVYAAEPYMRQPWDLDEWSKRLEELSAKFPASVELLVYLGAAHHARLQENTAIAVYERALALDPGLVAARLGEAESLSSKGDTGAQLRAYAACLDTSPLATQCLLKQLTLRAQLGDCAAMKADAQRLLSIDPGSSATHHQMALSLYATGSSSDSVLEALGRRWALETEADRKAIELQDRAAVAAATGDFTGAEKRLEEWLAAVADKPDQVAHAAPAQRLAELYTEMGLPRKASDAADSFLKRMNAWTEPTGGSSAMLFLSYRLRAGAISRDEYERIRGEAMEKFRARWTSAGRKLDDDFAWLAWSMAYGTGVTTAEEAHAAADAMPKVRSKAVDSGRWASVDLAAGRTYALAGLFDQALAALGRAGSPCLVLTDPVERTGAQLYLGMALEGTGDKDGARAAYRAVVERWGKANARSVTAEKAKQRLAALGDKKN
jgi:serine/threonine protein kinase/tetratricopeptide (TPR) repeat protein